MFDWCIIVIWSISFLFLDKNAAISPWKELFDTLLKLGFKLFDKYVFFIKFLFLIFDLNLFNHFRLLLVAI